MGSGVSIGYASDDQMASNATNGGVIGVSEAQNRFDFIFDSQLLQL